MLISHDIDVVWLFCERVAVMYLGELIEKDNIDDVLDFPAHPYTRVLLGSVPSLDPTDRTFDRPLTETIPDPSNPPSGCRFHTRCPEIIPPDEVDLPSPVWQAVAELRFTLQAGELPETLRDDSGDIESAIRTHFGLPETIPDDRIDRVVNDALTAVADGDEDRASEVLADEISTVCERQSPAGSDHDGRPVSCHRYDPDIDAEPLSWSEE